MSWHVAAFFLGVLLGSAAGHTRLVCPPPRSGETGAKVGPCDAPDNPTQPAFELQPGLNTITWEESIPHPQAPARIALSLDGSDEGFEHCVLLDHVPNNDDGRPDYKPADFFNPETYVPYRITVYIPDVYCERCNIQLITFMSDEIHQVPEGTYCVEKFAKVAGLTNQEYPVCPVVYHSCAPVKINGSTPRSNYTCSLPSSDQLLGWPFMQGLEGSPTVSTYYYRGDPGAYSDGDLLSAPSTGPIQCDAKFVEPAGPCGGPPVTCKDGLRVAPETITSTGVEPSTMEVETSLLVSSTTSTTEASGSWQQAMPMGFLPCVCLLATFTELLPL